MNKLTFLFLGVFVFALIGMGFASAQVATVCCEKTNKGAFCQNVPANECAAGARQLPTACDSTSFCKAGTCYDSSEGTCLDNTPQIVCNANDGVWSENSPAQCGLGCCILGDQAAFVTLVRCKKLSSFLGLKANFNNGITDELSCIGEVQKQDKGACVYEFEFEKTCKFTTRGECEGSEKTTNGTISSGVFYKNKLCSAEELATNCGPSQKTSCLAGKDEVYFLDTCGNPANIYDAGKLKDKEYWSNVKTKAESCNANGANAGSASCGNCNYLGGSYCRDSDVAGKNPSYGDFICADLNCQVDGVKRLHGESWCTNDEKVKEGLNSVGSRFFRSICQNGEVVVEACDDFRAETCIEGSIETNFGKFSQAACRVNRWQDCLAQTERQDCENTDRRDCFWKDGVKLGNSTAGGTCLPQNSPGLNFWNNEETRAICGQGNAVCLVKFEKGLFGGEKCIENCDCLEAGWENERAGLCSALGDCGPKKNWVGVAGYKQGFNVTVSKKAPQ